jgi:hypothetical protein
MQKKLQCPRRPVRAAWLTFLGLSAYVTVFLPFTMDELPPKSWPLLYGYCALLAIAVIGLLRLSRLTRALLFASAAVASIPAAIGVAMVYLPHRAVDGGTPWLGAMPWLRVSLYLFYAVGVWALCLIGKGWLLHFREPRDKPA